MTLETILEQADAGLAEIGHDHLVRVRVEVELAAEQALARWYEQYPERMGIRMDDLYQEHRVRLALLEKLVR